MAILVKVQATALNPVDAKMVDLHGPSLDGCVGGYDFAGYIVAIGSKAQTQEPPHDTPLQVGSRVAGIVLGGNPLRPRVGAFCEYVLADPKFVLIIPDVISFEEGASLGLPVATAGMALYQSLGLKLPAENGSPPDTRAETEEQINDEWALVLGGSSATGTMAIQMLKL
jgi:NADPH:quinone reductase-like Zn-dependent oxidoreductase